MMAAITIGGNGSCRGNRTTHRITTADRHDFGLADQGYALLSSEPEESDRLRHHVRTGRPLGSRRFVETAERLLGRRLRPCPAGRPSKDEK